MCNRETSGWIRMSVQVVSRVAVLVPLPDNNTAVPCVNPARCRSVQLTTQAGSTHCLALLISYSIKVICIWLCTRHIHKRVQSSIVRTSKITHSFCFCLYCIFSVHFQELSAAKQTMRTSLRAILERPKLKLSSPEWRVKSGWNKKAAEAASDVISLSVSLPCANSPRESKKSN